MLPWPDFFISIPFICVAYIICVADIILIGYIIRDRRERISLNPSEPLAQRGSCANGLYFGMGFGGVAIGLGRGIFRVYAGEVVIAYKLVPPAVGVIVDVFFHGCFLLFFVFEVEVIQITLIAVGSGEVWRVRDR
jgi:hypothetical protein